MAPARAASLVAPGPKLAALRRLLDAGATARLTLELAGADGVAATSVLTSTDHAEAVVTVWTALHALRVTTPDPFASTRAACNALGRAAQEDAVLAEARAKLAAAAAAVAALEARRATPPGSRDASTPVPAVTQAAKPAGGEERGGDGGQADGADEDEDDGNAAEGADVAAAREHDEEEPAAGAKGASTAKAALKPAATKPAAAKPVAAKPVAAKPGARAATIGGKSVTSDELTAAVAVSKSWHDVATTLGCGGSAATTKARSAWEKWNPGVELPFPAPGRGRPRAAGEAPKAPTPKRRKAVKDAEPEGEEGDLF